MSQSKKFDLFFNLVKWFFQIVNHIPIKININTFSLSNNYIYIIILYINLFRSIFHRNISISISKLWIVLKNYQRKSEYFSLRCIYKDSIQKKGKEMK